MKNGVKIKNEHGINNNNVVEIKNLSIEFKTRTTIVPAVKDISFTLKKGETYGLVGESGCGKSTMAFASMGYLADNGRVTTGSVIFDGIDLTKTPRKKLRTMWGKKIAMVYQDPSSYLNPALTIGEQLAEIYGASSPNKSKKIYDQIFKLLESVQFPDPVRIINNYPHQLSGGMRQKVCIAMALAQKPDLLIMDEPTTALDVTTEAVVLDLIKKLKKEYDLAILYITHDLGVVARICEKVGVMYLGRIVEEATVEDLFRNPVHPYTRGLLNCIPKLDQTKYDTELTAIPGSVGRPESIPVGCPFALRCYNVQESCRETDPTLLPVCGNHLCSCLFPEVHENEKGRYTNLVEQHSNEIPAKLLEINDLQHHYVVSSGIFQSPWATPQTVKAVDHISLDVNKNQTVSIVGESGCGKSTLARLIVGLLPPKNGNLLLEGKDIGKKAERRSKEDLNKISIVFQNPDSTLNPKHTIGFTLLNAMKQRTDNLSHDEKVNKALEYLEMVNLGKHYFGRYSRELSGGEKQRAAIARALASNPDLIVCDEPTSALDVSVQASILTLLLKLQNELNLSYLIITHDLSVVHYLSDHIAVMYLGQICEQGPANEVFKPPYHPYTEALLSAIPIPDPNIEQNDLRLHGRVPSLINIPKGCRFNTRCPRKLGSVCEIEKPPLQESSDGHFIRCHIPCEELAKFGHVLTKLKG